MNRPYAALGLFCLSALVAGALGWLLPLGEMTEMLIISLGYANVALCLGVLLVALVRDRPMRLTGGGLRGLAGPAVAVALAAAWLLSIEPFMLKIINDELMIASTAQMMHLDRAPAVARFANWNTGAFFLHEAFLDKRPFFFPFLVSLLHDLTGYRLGNVFVVNAALTAALLAAGFAVAARVAGRAAGYLFVLLMAFCPVLAQGATSGNASVLNAALIAFCLWLGLRYHERPDRQTLVPLVYGLLLLAQTRYESSVYILPFGLLILAGWARARAVILPPAVLLAPLLLVLNVLHQRYSLKYDGFYWQAGPNNRTDTFSWHYIGENLRATWDFLFNLDYQLPNSLLLSIVGLVGLLLLLIAVARRRLAPEHVAPVVLITGLFLANVAVVLLFNFGLFTVYATSRLSLPMHLFLALFGALALQVCPRPLVRCGVLLFVLIAFLQTLGYTRADWMDKGLFLAVSIVAVSAAGLWLTRPVQPSPRALLLAFLAASLAFLAPKMRAKPYFYGYPAPHAVKFFMDFIADHGAKDTLFLTSNPSIAVLLGQNGAPTGRFFAQADPAEPLRSGHYRRIFVCHTQTRPMEGVLFTEGSEPFVPPPSFSARLVESKRLHPGYLAFVYELHLAEQSPGAAGQAAEDEPPGSNDG